MDTNLFALNSMYIGTLFVVIINMITLYILLTQFLWAQTPQYQVYLDITRGVQKGCVYQGDKEMHCFRLSGGRNKKDSAKKIGRFCSYTTTGESFTPQTVMKNRKSNEFGANLKYFVGFDEQRGIGTHTGDISGYSGGCIRLREKDAKYLHDLVKENSEMRGQLVLSSNVAYTVVDNTPDRQENECACVTKHLRNMTVHKERASQICAGEPFQVELPKYLRPKSSTTEGEQQPNIRPKKRPESLNTATSEENSSTMTTSPRPKQRP